MKLLFQFVAIILLFPFQAPAQVSAQIPAQVRAQQFLETKQPAEHDGNCIFLGRTLCHALQDKPVLSLATAQSAALLADGVTTTQFEKRGFIEINPVARMLLGARPKWQGMAPLGALQVVGQMWLAERLKTSRRLWVRKVWWLPLAVGISGNSAASIENSNLR